MKRYHDINGEHVFDDMGKYVGYTLYCSPSLKFGPAAPFKDWDVWTEDKHSFLVEQCGFKYEETPAKPV